MSDKTGIQQITSISDIWYLPTILLHSTNSESSCIFYYGVKFHHHGFRKYGFP